MSEVTKENFPLISEKQVNALDKLIPNKCPNLLDTEREIWYNVGRRSVVELLVEIFRLQSDPNNK